MAAVTGALDPCGLPINLDLLDEVLPVAVEAESVVALQCKRLFLGVIIADIASEVLHFPDLRAASVIDAKASCFKYLILILHKMVQQALAVPSEISEEDRRLFGRKLKDVFNLVDDSVLIIGDILGTIDLEVYLVWCFLRLLYFLKAGIAVIKLVKVDI
jgi:hypothetical protein